MNEYRNHFTKIVNALCGHNPELIKLQQVVQFVQLTLRFKVSSCLKYNLNSGDNWRTNFAL